MAGNDNATTPYHTITLEGVGNVVGFWVGFSQVTCCRIWLGSPIHFILLLDSLYTYIMMYGMLYMWWVAIRVQHHTIPYHHSVRAVWGGESVGMYYTLLCNDWDLSHFILIPDPLHTYKRWLTYCVCVGQSYECVLIPLSSQKPWPSLVLT